MTVVSIEAVSTLITFPHRNVSNTDWQSTRAAVLAGSLA